MQGQLRDAARDAVDRIPPDAWPLIDLFMKITVALALIWLAFAVIAWWRRRAYNLTVASTADRNRKAQPDFLHVDTKARDAAIERGAAHEAELDERERIEAAIAAGKDPTTWGARLAAIATAAMSVLTLITGVLGVVGNVGSMESSLSQVSGEGKIEYIVSQHPIGTIIVLFAIGYQVWRYVHHRKWEKE